MSDIFNYKKTLFVHASLYREIVDAILFVKSIGIENVVLVGGADAHYTVPLLKKHSIPVILSDVHRLPVRTGEDVDLPYRMPGILTNSGVMVALSYKWLMNSRNLPFFAGTAACYGLSKEKALQLVTKNTAQVLGVDNTTGTIEVGKDANIVISKGDILDMKTNNITHAFIKGKRIKLEAKQQKLYNRYKEKYDQ